MKLYDTNGNLLLKLTEAPAKLDDIDDVQVPSPPDGYVLYWDQAAAKWKCKVEAGAVDHLGDIGDVNVPTPSDDDVLYWDAVASKWQARKLVDADIPSQICRDTEADSKVSTHAALTADIHGVAADRFVAETSVADLDLASHKARHQNGGADEVSVAGLSGELADNQPPKAHQATHQNGGADEINLAGLDGEPSTLTTHKDAATGVHGVGSHYLAYTKGSQKEALFHNTHMARAWLGADQANIEDQTYTKVNLDTESFDPGNNFDTTNHKYTAPVAGYYVVAYGVLWKDSNLVADKRYSCKLYKNGAGYSLVIAHASFAHYISNFGVDVLHLNASDYLELYAYHNAGVNNIIIRGTDEAYTFLSIALLQAD